MSCITLHPVLYLGGSYLYVWIADYSVNLGVCCLLFVCLLPDVFAN